jgi:hypothetical protein
MTEVLLFTCEEYADDNARKFINNMRTYVPDTYYDNIVLNLSDPNMDLLTPNCECRNQVITYKDSEGVVHHDSFNTSRQKFLKSLMKYYSSFEADESDKFGEFNEVQIASDNNFQNVDMYYQFNGPFTSHDLLQLIVKAYQNSDMSYICINAVYYNPKTCFLRVEYST